MRRQVPNQAVKSHCRCWRRQRQCFGRGEQRGPAFRFYPSPFSSSSSFSGRPERRTGGQNVRAPAPFGRVLYIHDSVILQAHEPQALQQVGSRGRPPNPLAQAVCLESREHRLVLHGERPESGERRGPVRRFELLSGGWGRGLLQRSAGFCEYIYLKRGLCGGETHETVPHPHFRQLRDLREKIPEILVRERVRQAQRERRQPLRTELRCETVQ